MLKNPLLINLPHQHCQHHHPSEQTKLKHIVVPVIGAIRHHFCELFPILFQAVQLHFDNTSLRSIDIIGEVVITQATEPK